MAADGKKSFDNETKNERVAGHTHPSRTLVLQTATASTARGYIRAAHDHIFLRAWDRDASNFGHPSTAGFVTRQGWPEPPRPELTAGAFGNGANRMGRTFETNRQTASVNSDPSMTASYTPCRVPKRGHEKRHALSANLPDQ